MVHWRHVFWFSVCLSVCPKCKVKIPLSLNPVDNDLNSTAERPPVFWSDPTASTTLCHDSQQCSMTPPVSPVGQPGLIESHSVCLGPSRTYTHSHLVHIPYKWLLFTEMFAFWFFWVTNLTMDSTNNALKKNHGKLF